MARRLGTHGMEADGAMSEGAKTVAMSIRDEFDKIDGIRELLPLKVIDAYATIDEDGDGRGHRRSSLCLWLGDADEDGYRGDDWDDPLSNASPPYDEYVKALVRIDLPEWLAAVGPLDGDGGGALSYVASKHDLKDGVLPVAIVVPVEVLGEASERGVGVGEYCRSNKQATMVYMDDGFSLVLGTITICGAGQERYRDLIDAEYEVTIAPDPHDSMETWNFVYGR